VDGGDWTNVTFANASDMATGNYISEKFEEDENGPQEEDSFIAAESYAEKIKPDFHSFLIKQLLARHSSINHTYPSSWSRQ
jgi:hypothetical protein